MSGRYAKNNLDAYTPPNCPRCGKPATYAWAEATIVTDPVPMCQPSRHWCETPGCVDEDGYNRIFPQFKPTSYVLVEQVSRFGWEVKRHDGWIVMTSGKVGRKRAQRIAEAWRAQQAKDAADG